MAEPSLSRNSSAAALQSLVSYGRDSDEGSDADEYDHVDTSEGNTQASLNERITPSPSNLSASSLVAYTNEEDTKPEKVENAEETSETKERGGSEDDSTSRGPEVADERSNLEDSNKGTQLGELGTVADISEDDDEDEDNLKKEAARLNYSITSEPETALSMKIRRMSAEEVTLPPAPKGRCSKHLQEKILLYTRKSSRTNMNEQIQRRKDFRNPSIYEKLISYLGIDELGTNYPKDVYDPHSWSESSYYESLAKAQKEDMAKREKEKKERTKVEFVSGVAKKPSVKQEEPTGITIQRVVDEERKRKTKWDAPALNPNQQIPLVMLVTNSISQPTVVSTSTSAKSNKTTIISAVGTIKKAKIEKVEKKE